MGTSANLVFIQVYGKSFKGVGLTSAISLLICWFGTFLNDKINTKTGVRTVHDQRVDSCSSW